MTLTIIAILIAAGASLLFATLTYSLRDYSKPRLEEHLERRGLSEWYEKTLSIDGDLIFVTAILRLLSNILVLVSVLHLMKYWTSREVWQVVFAVVITGVITLLSSVAVPHALASNAASGIIASQVRVLHAIHLIMSPIAKLMHGVDAIVARALRVGQVESANAAEQEIQDEILSVVEEGTKEGTVDPREREMIESVIEFRATTVGQVMTALPQISALPVTSSLEQIRHKLQESGHSRLPMFEGSLDHIVGILYARDLLRFVGAAQPQFEIRSMLRPAFFVPKTKSLRDMLTDFKHQKMHLAIVLDEYGGTTGLVTIEDVLEEIVGDITDEHEPLMPSMIRKIDDRTFETDARATIEDINTNLHLDLPEDEGYETIGGFVSNTIGRIPPAGAKVEHASATLTVLEAEPQRINRLRIEMKPTSTSV